MKTMEINGKTFEVTMPRKNKPDFEQAQRYNGMDLSYYYSRPSEAKRHIYNYWCNWFYGLQGGETIGVSGANCFRFTITATYIDEHNRKWVLVITDMHNRAILAE